MGRIYNFSAGPAVLPEDVLKVSTDKIQELVDKYNKMIDEILDNKTKDLMSI